MCPSMYNLYVPKTVYLCVFDKFCLRLLLTNREYFKPLGGKFSEDTPKKGKGANTGRTHHWRSFYSSQYDWLKGSRMTKVVWLPNETDYSYCEVVAQNTPCYQTLSNDDTYLISQC